MSKFKGATWRVGGTEIEVTRLPDRKKPCLLIKEEGSVNFYPVANFSDSKAAEMFIRVLDKVAIVFSS